MVGIFGFANVEITHQMLRSPEENLCIFSTFINILLMVCTDAIPYSPFTHTIYNICTELTLQMQFLVVYVIYLPLKFAYKNIY